MLQECFGISWEDALKQVQLHMQHMFWNSCDLSSAGQGVQRR